MIIIVLSLFLEGFSVTSSDGQGHLMFTGLMCNVQSFMDRLQATATTPRGEFLFKSLLKLPELDSPPPQSLSCTAHLSILLSRVSLAARWYLKMGLSGYEPTMEDMRGIFLAQGPGKIRGRGKYSRVVSMSHEGSSITGALNK